MESSITTFEYEKENKIDFSIMSNSKKILLEIKNLHSSEIRKNRRKLIEELLNESNKENGDKSKKEAGSCRTNWGAHIDFEETTTVSRPRPGISIWTRDITGKENEELNCKTKILDYILEFEKKLNDINYDLSTMFFVVHVSEPIEHFLGDVFHWYYKDYSLLKDPYANDNIYDSWFKSKGITKIKNINSFIVLNNPEGIIWDWNQQKHNVYFKKENKMQVEYLSPSMLNIEFQNVEF